MPIKKYKMQAQTVTGTYDLLPAQQGISYHITRIGMAAANTAATGCTAVLVQTYVPDPTMTDLVTIGQIDLVPSVANVQNCPPSAVDVVTKSNSAVYFKVFGADCSLSIAWIEYYEMQGVTEFPDDLLKPGNQR